MSDSKTNNENSKEQAAPPHGAIIDATAHRRPRVRASDSDRAKTTEGLDFLRDITLRVNVVLAETKMTVGDVLALGTDSVVQLDKPSGDPLDIHVEDQKLGKGEVIVLQEKLRVRVLEITPPSQGAKEASADKMKADADEPENDAGKPESE